MSRAGPSLSRTVLATARDDDDETELTVYWDASLGSLRLGLADATRPVDPDAPLPSVQPGIWRHRGGADYLVLGVAHDDRGGEPRVIYVRLYSRDGVPVTARRVSVFTDSDDDGPRFRWVGRSQHACTR